MSRRKSKFAPKEELSLEELMPDRNELARIGHGGQINPETFAIKSQAAHRLRQAIQMLPPEYRIVLVLRDMEGLADDEVAEITGLRPGTVRVRLHRARLFVRKELSHEKHVARRTSRARAASTLDQGRSAQPSGIFGEPRPARCKALFAELSNYIDEQLDDSLCAELEKHFDGCEPCKAFLSNLEATIEQCRHAPSDCPDSRLATKLRKELMENYYRISALHR
jgi:RNA polymerase sigma-70 factor (ECF subfamily)